jgi:hypothetical protein
MRKNVTKLDYSFLVATSALYSVCCYTMFSKVFAWLFGCISWLCSCALDLIQLSVDTPQNRYIKITACGFSYINKRVEIFPSICVSDRFAARHSIHSACLQSIKLSDEKQTFRKLEYVYSRQLWQRLYVS